MIYCVIPSTLAGELYERLVDYYRDEPAVEVIVDRRSGPDRRSVGGAPSAATEQRQTRDRRRRGIAGTFPAIDVPE